MDRIFELLSKNESSAYYFSFIGGTLEGIKLIVIIVILYTLSKILKRISALENEVKEIRTSRNK